MKLSNYQKHFSDGEWTTDGTRGRGQHRFQMIDWNLIKGRSVLDLGCANGMLAIEAKRRGATEVVGVDNGKWIPAVRETIKGSGIDVEFWELDIESPEFKNFCPKFDIVFFCSMLYHMHDPEGMLRWIDSHTKKVLYFESNLGESRKPQIEYVKNFTSFDVINFLGRSDPPEDKGVHYMWTCGRRGKENKVESWKDLPVTFIPLDRIRGPREKACERVLLNERIQTLKKNIQENGLMSPLIVVKSAGIHFDYKGVEGGKRYCILKELGRKDIPCKIIPNTPVREQVEEDMKKFQLEQLEEDVEDSK